MNLPRLTHPHNLQWQAPGKRSRDQLRRFIHIPRHHHHLRWC